MLMRSRIMETHPTQMKITLAQRRFGPFFGILLFICFAGWAGASVIVFDNSATGSIHLFDQNSSYSGAADFSLELTGIGPLGDDLRARASAHFTTANGFETSVLTAAEHASPRTAQADAIWEFRVTGSDTTFTMSGFHEVGGVTWSVEDLTANAVIGTQTFTGGFGNISGGGALLLGHNYRLTESAQTLGNSDEQATLSFKVGTDVTFQPQSHVPEAGGIGTTAAFFLTVAGMCWWRGRRGTQNA